MSGARRGRRGVAANESVDQDDGNVGGSQRSPPNPPPLPGNIPRSSPLREAVPRSPPPRYQEINAGIMQGLANLPGLMMQMQNAMLENQRAMLNALEGFGNIRNIRHENNLPQGVNANPRAEYVLPPAHNAQEAPPGIFRVHANENPVHGNNVNHGNGHLRTQHLKTTDAKLPKYLGSSDEKTPDDFIPSLVRKI